ncbi:hypothetical protein ACQ4M3_20520 [Leptolyngbya sp. AN03gr2]|uniref:hypothetical protein n=1 Tax=unclassified Leptolyngbya TaxID=2650499 RepID=UPI003D320B9C
MNSQQNHQNIRNSVKVRALSSINISLVLLAGFVALYLGFQDPLLLATLGATGIITLSTWYIGKSTPLLERVLKTRLRPWHMMTAALTIGVIVNMATPAHAVFLSGLETFITGIVTASAAQSGSTAIPPAVIGLVFNLFRLAFLLLVVAAALYAYNQAQQGNDWRPIVTQVAIAIAMVIAIDILTALFVKKA